MSYEKVQNLTIKKDGTISINSAPSNIFPIEYRTSKIIAGSEKTYLDNISDIFSDLLSGCMKFNFSSKSKVRLAYFKTLKRLEPLSTWDLYMIDGGKEAFENEWNKEYFEEIENKLQKEITLDLIEDIRNETFNIFLEEIEIAKNTKLVNEFLIKVPEGYLVRPTSSGYSYSYVPRKTFNEAQALDYIHNNQEASIEKVL